MAQRQVEIFLMPCESNLKVSKYVARNNVGYQLLESNESGGNK